MRERMVTDCLKDLQVFVHELEASLEGIGADTRAFIMETMRVAIPHAISTHTSLALNHMDIVEAFASVDRQGQASFAVLLQEFAVHHICGRAPFIFYRAEREVEIKESVLALSEVALSSMPTEGQRTAAVAAITTTFIQRASALKAQGWRIWHSLLEISLNCDELCAPSTQDGEVLYHVAVRGLIDGRFEERRADSSISAMRPPCYYLLEEIVILG